MLDWHTKAALSGIVQKHALPPLPPEGNSGQGYPRRALTDCESDLSGEVSLLSEYSEFQILNQSSCGLMYSQLHRIAGM